MALDESPIEEAARHALEVTYGANLPEITVLLQGNIPYKKKGIIDQVIAELLQDDTLDSSVTVYCPDPHLYSLKFIENGVLKPVFSARDIYRRQQAQRYYIIDGSVYAIRTETLMETTPRSSAGRRSNRFHMWIFQRSNPGTASIFWRLTTGSRFSAENHMPKCFAPSKT